VHEFDLTEELDGLFEQYGVVRVRDLDELTRLTRGENGATAVAPRSLRR
jgi:hypothetical protein